MWERHVTFGLGSINKSREPCTDTGKCRAVRIVRVAGVSPIKLVTNSGAEFAHLGSMTPLQPSLADRL